MSNNTVQKGRNFKQQRSDIVAENSFLLTFFRETHHNVLFNTLSFE